ncbi:hypothetical protein DLn1_00027 [Bacillus phage DLn1]|nr:hypothetical protein DLn1_00027 [Bacillus phage DLn1]
MMTSEIANFVVNNGFAIFVGVYMLTTQNKVLQDNTKAINELIVIVKDLKLKDVG